MVRSASSISKFYVRQQIPGYLANERQYNVFGGRGSALDWNENNATQKIRQWTEDRDLHSLF